jgi:hypothetical protein
MTIRRTEQDSVSEYDQEYLGIGRFATGPIWYHGTNSKAAESMVRTGFKPKARIYSGLSLGHGVYFAPRVVAVIFGDVLVAVRLNCPLIDWDSDQAAVARRACGYPASYRHASLLGEKTARLSKQLPGAMLNRGIRAVRYVDDVTGHVEVCVYDPRVIEVVGIVDYDEPVPDDPRSPRLAVRNCSRLG